MTVDPSSSNFDVSASDATIIEQVLIEIQANPELILGGVQLKTMGDQAWAAMKSRYADGATSLINNVTNQALEKADQIFNFQQNLVSSIGSQTAAYANMEALQRGVYDLSLLHKGTLADTEISYLRFFESEEQMLKEFNQIIDDNLLLTHFAANATQEQIAELPILARALGFKEDMMKTFMRRQFARTGEANDDLLKSTLAHALAAERATGISSKIITEHVGVMMSEVSLFGDMTEEQMTRAAVEVAQLGLEMSTVTSMVREFNDFESAAGNVAKLTQALGLQVDVMDAVALANESPEQLMQMFRQQFDIAGIDVHSLSMPMKRALADIFGARDTQEVEQMFGNASHGLSEFLAQADEGLASVGDPEVDQALAMAASNLERRRILEGDAAQMGREFALNAEQALSTAMATTMNRQKERFDTMTVGLMQTQGEMIQDGLMDPLTDSLTGASDLVFGKLEENMGQFESRFRTFIAEIQTIGFEAAGNNFMGLQSPEEVTAAAARVVTAETNANNFVAETQANIEQASGTSRIEINTLQDYNAIRAALTDELGATGLGIQQQALNTIISDLAALIDDDRGRNNVIEITPGTDGITVSVGTDDDQTRFIPVYTRQE